MYLFVYFQREWTVKTPTSHRLKVFLIVLRDTICVNTSNWKILNCTIYCYMYLIITAHIYRVTQKCVIGSVIIRFPHTTIQQQTTLKTSRQNNEASLYMKIIEHVWNQAGKESSCWKLSISPCATLFTKAVFSRGVNTIYMWERVKHKT